MLLQNIQETKKIIQNITNHSYEYNEILKKPIGPLFTVIGLAAWIYALVELGISRTLIKYSDMLLFNPFISPLNLPKKINAILVATDLVFLHAGSFMLIVFILNHLILARRLSRQSDRLKYIQLAVERDIQSLYHSIIPEDYWSEEIVDKLEKYVINQRATSIKECLNLYEQERMHEEMMGRIVAAEDAAHAAHAEANAARAEANAARAEAERHHN